METLLQWDYDVFIWINDGLKNSFFDWLMPVVRNKFVWIPLYLAILYFVARKYHFYVLIWLAFWTLVIVFTDQLSSSTLKPLIERLRPCHDPLLKDQVNLLLGKCGGMYGFVSSHAANHFGMAAFFGTAFGSVRRWIWPVAMLWAGLISFAQVYVGVHFPGDIIGGALLGIFVGVVIGLIAKKVVKSYFSRQ